MSEREKIKLLFQEIQQGNREAFNHLFTIYYWRMVAFAKQYTKQIESAEEISSELFVKLWLKRVQLSNILNPEVYLYVSVKNACLNLIRSGKRQGIVVSEDEINLEVGSTNYSHLEDKELVKLLDAVVSSLPEQRKIIFKLIKEDGLKASAVAQILGLSKRTVENQLYKAVKSLADELSNYLGYHPQGKATKKNLPPALSILFF